MTEKLGISKEILEDRYENYAILARLFISEVDQDLLDNLVSSPAPELTGNVSIDEPFAAIRAYLDQANDKTRSELAIDYCTTFLGYGANPDAKEDEIGSLAAYPYESVYRSNKKSLIGEVSVAVEMLYRQNGFNCEAKSGIGRDHIGHELGFLKFLSGLEILDLEETDGEHIREYLEVQLAFLDEHLLKWAPEFAEQVSNYSETVFYPALSRLAIGILAADRDFISTTLNDATLGNATAGV